MILELISRYDVPVTSGQRVSEIMKNDLKFLYCRTQQITKENVGNLKDSSPYNGQNPQEYCPFQRNRKTKNIFPVKEDI